MNFDTVPVTALPSSDTAKSDAEPADIAELHVFICIR